MFITFSVCSVGHRSVVDDMCLIFRVPHSQSQPNSCNSWRSRSLLTVPWLPVRCDTLRPNITATSHEPLGVWNHRQVDFCSKTCSGEQQRKHKSYVFLVHCPPVTPITISFPSQRATNKIWWLCLVQTSTTRFASDVGYRMAKNLIGLYKEIIFMNDDI